MATLGALLLIFLYEVAAAIILPTPSELPVLGHRQLPLGWIFFFAVAGKTVGSYVVFFIGDRAKETERFRRLAARHRWMQAVLGWSERFVRRFGFLAVLVLLSIPGFPDTVSLYLFAIVGNRPVLFSLAAGLGTGVRILLVLFVFRGFGHAAT